MGVRSIPLPEKSKMQYLTVAEVAQANRKALAEHTLLAESGDARSDRQHRTLYAYERGPWRCAIGCALNKETLAIIAKRRWQKMPLSFLISKGIVETADNSLLESLQSDHDFWLRTGLKSRYTQTLENIEKVTGLT